MKTTTAVLAIILLAGGAAYGSSPIQISLTPELALHNRGKTIEGLTVGLWSENPQTALALGLVNGSTGQSAGVSWALLLNYADNYKGIQWAPVNYTTGDFLGWQAGVVNYAGHLRGLQLGFVNYAETADTGLQLGLVNLLPQNAWFTDLPDGLAPGMVFVNWRF